MEEQTKTNSGAPLNIISWKEKEKDDQQWYKDKADYYIKNSSFGDYIATNGSRQNNMELLYQVYNNKFPMNWFDHITNPLNAQKAEHKNFPAKVRPVNILRTNLDQLLGEYPRRPFIYQVNNLGDDGYSRYTEQLNKAINDNTVSYFQLALQKELMAQGLIGPDGQPASEEAMAEVQKRMDAFQPPADIVKELTGSYRDKIAIQGQKWLRRAISEHSIREKFLKMFKDWLIVGQAYSYKSVQYDNLVYERISPLMIAYDKSPDVDNVENGDWVVVKRMLTLSDFVDKFYEEVKEKDLKKLDRQGLTAGAFADANGWYTSLKGEYGNNLIPVYHVQWKGKKKIGFLTVVNADGQIEEIQVDEDYPINKEIGETVEWMWVNEVYETWRAGNNGTGEMYFMMGPVAIQRNALNNFSSCKLSYNGRKYSDTHADNISVMEIGIPFQIMYMIINWTLEKTIAKSKGKILFIDKNAIPDDDDWDDEKFFYYAEGLGYALLNRNQAGVDKSWNQYAVQDLTLFDSIKQLIELQNHYKQEWDDIIGFSRQRKGQTYSSDLVGNNERSIFQSTVITDMIFNLFDEFKQSELQGFMDLSRFTNASGLRKMYYDTEVGNQVLDIVPEEYCNSELGVLVESSTEAIALKNKMESIAQGMIQNNAKPSTILEIFHDNNIASLKQKLKDIERIADEAAQATQQSEQEAEADADQRQKDFMEYEKMLNTQYMNAEYDRKEDIELLVLDNQPEQPEVNNDPDSIEIDKQRLARNKFEDERAQKIADRQARITGEQQSIKLKRDEMAMKQSQHKDNIAVKKQQIRKQATKAKTK